MRLVDYEPVYKHDCGACHYLGFAHGGDWYWCPSRIGDDRGSIIQRASSDPPDYCSSRVDFLWQEKWDHKKSRYRKVPPTDPMGWAFLAYNIWKVHVEGTVYVQGKEKKGDA